MVLTAFGLKPSFSSPAARRIEEAGRRFMEKATAKERAEKAAIARQKAILEAERIERLRRQRMAAVEMNRLLVREAISKAPEKPLSFTVTLRHLLTAVCWKYGVDSTEMMSHRRGKIIPARQEFCWLAKRHTWYSYPQIGKFLGGRDHTTIIHSVRRYQKRIDEMRAARRAEGQWA